MVTLDMFSFLTDYMVLDSGPGSCGGNVPKKKKKCSLVAEKVPMGFQIPCKEFCGEHVNGVPEFLKKRILHCQVASSSRDPETVRVIETCMMFLMSIKGVWIGKVSKDFQKVLTW